MIRIKKLAHVAVCVPNIEEASATFARLFGLQASEPERSELLNTEAVLLPIGETLIELITPFGENEGLLRFLAKRGPGIHHIAVEIEGLDAALEFLKALRVPLIDETPRVGAQGHRVAFIHPKATGGVLIELVEPAAQQSDENTVPNSPGSRYDRI